MRLDETVTRSTIPSPVNQTGETGMMQRERWEEVRRLFYQERMRIREIARCLDLDRNTVRRCIRSESWQPYWREGRADTLLGEHADFLRQRAPQVNYSARILYQELSRGRGYGGSYDTVKRFVQPLREVAVQAEQVLTRFETPPGWQSQVDWGQGRVYFGQRAVVQHFFVLTLGYSRRGFYCAYPDEKLGCFLEAHERAFEHFGGHTREHLYDRPRTVCRPTEGGRVIWNPTFKAFAEYWGFEPRLCQPYRAQTKGKVESGVKYVKRNFILYLPKALHPCNPGSYLGAGSSTSKISTSSWWNGW
jgi:transposase